MIHDGEVGRDWSSIEAKGWPAWHPDGYECAPEFGQAFAPVYRCRIERDSDGEPQPATRPAGHVAVPIGDSEPIPEHGWRHFDGCRCGACATPKGGAPGSV